MNVKITFKPFTRVAREVAPTRRYYYVFGANQDGTGSRLLGLVWREATGKWTADPDVFPLRPSHLRTSVHTRGQAAQLLVQHRAESLQRRFGTGVPR